MDQEFKIGDVVRLKSGGPAMTVSHVETGANSVDGQPYLTCVWFDDGKERDGTYHPDTVEKE